MEIKRFIDEAPPDEDLPFLFRRKLPLMDRLIRWVALRISVRMRARLTALLQSPLCAASGRGWERGIYNGHKLKDARGCL